MPLNSGQNLAGPLLNGSREQSKRSTYHIIYTTKHLPKIMKRDNKKNQAWLKVTLSLKLTKTNTVL